MGNLRMVLARTFRRPDYDRALHGIAGYQLMHQCHPPLMVMRQLRRLPKHERGA